MATPKAVRVARPAKATEEEEGEGVRLKFSAYQTNNFQTEAGYGMQVAVVKAADLSATKRLNRRDNTTQTTPLFGDINSDYYLRLC
jgi:hypothetical protein